MEKSRYFSILSFQNRRTITSYTKWHIYHVRRLQNVYKLMRKRNETKVLLLSNFRQFKFCASIGQPMVGRGSVIFTASSDSYNNLCFFFFQQIVMKAIIGHTLCQMTTRTSGRETSKLNTHEVISDKTEPNLSPNCVMAFSSTHSVNFCWLLLSLMGNGI